MFSHHNIKLNLKTRKVSADLWLRSTSLCSSRGNRQTERFTVNLEVLLAGSVKFKGQKLNAKTTPQQIRGDLMSE